MTEIKINPSKIAQWLAIAVIIIGSIVDSALTRDQVRRNTLQLEENPPAVFAAEQKNIAKDVDEMKGDVKDLVKAFNEWRASN